uniref:NADH dehydrogenase [ubiquinone] 1 alpha subcomplex subunit 10, mitochondrial n=1 Tax=Amblyomma aureolatum TaxID=187763 RepID=A0A1E1X7V4_9ACAR
MAFSLLRISRCFTVIPGLPSTSCGNAVARCPVQMQHLAGMKTKAFRERVPKPKPFPYETKTMRSWHFLFDSTLSRFDENTRMIVVEGNIGSGKSALAKTIAEEFELKHFEEPSLDQLYVDDYGFDYRNLDHLLPPSCRSCDIKRFYQDPHNINVAVMQLHMYMLRFERHVDALVHMLNTGQGVVLERSCYSDFVFADTMHKFGYISNNALKMYHKCRHYSLPDLLKPHLVIYLDVPSDILLQRIRERNRPEEVNSKVLTKAYLDEIESLYKHNYLRSVRKETELLMYDWSHFGDTEMVLDDIERIDFEGYLADPYGPMMADWRKIDDVWNDYRYELTAEKDLVLNRLLMDLFDAPELFRSGEDEEVMLDVIEKFNKERQQYEKGFNKQLGDKWVLFKTKVSNWERMRMKPFVGMY